MAEIPTSARSATPTWKRQPVHVVYGGAHLFTETTCIKLGAIAQRSFAEYASEASSLPRILGVPSELAPAVFDRVQAKLAHEPIEDFRVDFEDGFGVRSNSEEDVATEKAARATAAAMRAQSLPSFFGIRVKPFNDALRERARRTLDLYLTTLLRETGNVLPNNFVVTLPKISNTAEVQQMVEALQPYPRIGIEIMVETAQSIFILPQLVAAAEGRCVGAHFGAYDYTASLGIASSAQDLLHPACNFARNMMLASLAPSGVFLSDGASTLLPIAPHRGANLTADQQAENRYAIENAWRQQYHYVRQALYSGFYQGWDLHPAQLPARYAALHTFFLEGLPAASARLRNFVAAAAQATHVSGIFDDAATGQILLNYFLRAINCGAVDEGDVPKLTGLTLGQLRSGSFVQIAQEIVRQQQQAQQ